MNEMNDMPGSYQTYPLVTGGKGMTIDINGNGRPDIGEPSLMVDITGPQDIQMVMDWADKGSVELTGKDLRKKFSVTFNPDNPESPRIPFGKAFDVEDARLRFNSKTNTGEIGFKH
jgi:hypothetical protein